MKRFISREKMAKFSAVILILYAWYLYVILLSAYLDGGKTVVSCQLVGEGIFEIIFMPLLLFVSSLSIIKFIDRHIEGDEYVR